ncbi:hypothetical protein JAAARDRAFT_62127 [Jaapia argillacea MUCL 33604]|uniref:Uncharacterized protein n=1 Tax=Jaapia argillacea MUCL 33604 TaxID=933084 RepID=A0A067PAM5_9AGAM|nr:hypothetical protein JAAARDRAFT_62127 [Jaapia argillacea MUCL 33604]
MGPIRASLRIERVVRDAEETIKDWYECRVAHVRGGRYMARGTIKRLSWGKDVHLGRKDPRGRRW